MTREYLCEHSNCEETVVPLMLIDRIGSTKGLMFCCYIHLAAWALSRASAKDDSPVLIVNLDDKFLLPLIAAFRRATTRMGCDPTKMAEAMMGGTGADELMAAMANVEAKRIVDVSGRHGTG